jgi:hypothetical protein
VAGESLGRGVSVTLTVASIHRKEVAAGSYQKLEAATAHWPRSAVLFPPVTGRSHLQLRSLDRNQVSTTDAAGVFFEVNGREHAHKVEGARQER